MSRHAETSFTRSPSEIDELYANREYDMAGYRARLTEASSAESKVPGVDSEGNSECPFADRLFEEAEEAVSKVASMADCIESHQLPVLDRAMAVSKTNLNTLSIDKARLRQAQLGRWYGNAEDAEESAYLRALSYRKQLEEIVERGRAILERYEGKRRLNDSGSNAGPDRTSRRDTNKTTSTKSPEKSRKQPAAKSGESTPKADPSRSAFREFLPALMAASRPPAVVPGPLTPLGSHGRAPAFLPSPGPARDLPFGPLHGPPPPPPPGDPGALGRLGLFG